MQANCYHQLRFCNSGATKVKIQRELTFVNPNVIDNKTYTGSFDTYGGLGKNNGSPGTSFFYHTGFLLITPSNLTMMQEAKHHLKRCVQTNRVKYNSQFYVMCALN
jgi:hypothetical protein